MAESTETISGKVTWFCIKKGMGFIKVPGAKRHIFFREADLHQDHHPKDGDIVHFEVVDHKHGPKAKKVRCAPATEEPARDLTKFPISLSHFEWMNLCKALRKECKNPNGPQLGRLAWMSVSSIEAAIMDFEKERAKANGNSPADPAGSADGAREGEVVQ